MRKVIALSTVLGLGALGIACGDTATNTNVVVKPAMTPASTPMVVSTPLTSMSPMVNGNTGSRMTTANANKTTPVNANKTSPKP